MSEHTPRTGLSGQLPAATGAMARMRALPGFTAAAVAFVLVAFMGAGAAVAVAKWQQSATATIAVTVGALAPAAVRAADIRCVADANSGKPLSDLIITWPASANATSYIVEPKQDNSGSQTYLQTVSHSGATPPATEARFGVKPGAQGQGHGPFRITLQPLNGATAGEVTEFSFRIDKSGSVWSYSCSP